jgi:hypothetical protein
MHSVSPPADKNEKAGTGSTAGLTFGSTAAGSEPLLNGNIYRKEYKVKITGGLFYHQRHGSS